MYSRGLTDAQVEQQRQLFGRNSTCEDEYRPPPFYQRFLQQLANPLIALLLASAGASAALQQWESAVGILVAVALVGLLGAGQEARTEACLEALRHLAPSRAHVLRNGHLQWVVAEDVVVGDVVEVRAGDRIAADVLIASASGLIVDEAVLSGESVGREVGEGDQTFMGCSVSHGWGRGVVQAVGGSTRFGRMVGLIRDAKCSSRTPLQAELDALATKLTVGSSLLIALITIGCLVLSTRSWLDIVMTAVSLAVAAIPEGLPLVSTVTMALAMRRLAKHSVIVKKMSAVEAMGGIRMVCFDKTGTLTANKLQLAQSAFDEDHCPSPSPLGVEGEFLRMAASCTDVTQIADGFIGNALDVCLVSHYHARHGEPLLDKTGTAHFSSEKRFMTVELADGRVIGKGAIECFQDAPSAKRLVDLASGWSDQGLRCIGFGVQDPLSHAYSLYGVLGFQDAVREDARDTIQHLLALNIIPVMLTGDGERTAVSVANVLSWPHLSGSSHSPCHYPLHHHYHHHHLGATATTVLSRQSPEDKLAFVDRMQRSGLLLAMVGDGVNDGAAVRRAQVGIAMGGPMSTQVARQAADIVLADDKLAGIVEAVIEGRSIVVNVQRFLGFQISCSMASLLLVLMSSGVQGIGRPSPLHLLMLNIVMDGPPAQSLALSHVRPADILSPPSPKLLDWPHFAACLLRAAVLSGLAASYTLTTPGGGDGRQRSLLPPLLLLSMCNAFSWTDDVRNKYLWCCVGVSLLLLLAASRLPLVEGVVGAGRLEAGEWLLLAGLSAVFMAVFCLGRTSAIRSLRMRLSGYRKL